MVSTFVYSLIFFASIEALLAHSSIDYYWRDYNGKIPEDAVLGGRDKYNKDIYIGQAYVQNEGLVVVQIDKGQSTVYAEMEGIKRLDKNIKILCGPPHSFYWMPSNLTKLHTDLKKKQLVVGGHEDGAKRYFVGRIQCPDGVCIGKVLEKGYRDRSVFYGVDRSGHQLKGDSYEVLVNEFVIHERGYFNFDENVL
ncbi:hypothetical protein Zmor_019833 [Zophobas morio]|uniref:Uncharacterized protein n=1 Tax=Zophobas morio TaxID=2755281 RepID=A0AA38M9F3_9CUCU|nr:hypothetical protein Zmor_019833 [Zophobas morio]